MPVTGEITDCFSFRGATFSSSEMKMMRDDVIV